MSADCAAREMEAIRQAFSPPTSLPLYVRVYRRRTSECMGYFDLRDGGVIALSDRLTGEEAQETLLHEIMHLAEMQLVEEGLLKAQSPEDYIEEMGKRLFRILKASGLWNDDGQRYQGAFEWEESRG